MLFKKRDGQDVPPSSINSPHPTKADHPSKKDTTAESKVKDVQDMQTANDFDYPSGLKLALLMVSIFVGMFLVALVGCRTQHLRACSTVRVLTSLTAGQAHHLNRNTPDYERIPLSE
jgi:hypothetical protein